MKDYEYQCWLRYEMIQDGPLVDRYRNYCGNLVFPEETPVISTAKTELVDGLSKMLNLNSLVTMQPQLDRFVLVGKIGSHSLIDAAIGDRQPESLNPDGFIIKTVRKSAAQYITITAASDRGLLYGVFRLLGLMQTGREIDGLNLAEVPANPLRMINHWDNLDGSIERGYAGNSIFYEQNRLTGNLTRIRDYARLLASVGINAVVINNVNVHQEETRLIQDRLDMVLKLADIFRNYGIQLFLSINYAAPVELGDLTTADPLDERVQQWWQEKTAQIYQQIPDFGGFLVKADSEHRPGPFTYHRNHAEGANMLAEALQPFGGVVIWRCFVYNCMQDWRDRLTDRAKAAYDNFKPLDGMFADNVILQIKNGPMDFQVREPVSPLFGALEHTNQMLELQITQEYTGQQVHLCYLVPQWKAVLDFDTYARGPESYVKKIVDGSLFQRGHSGFAGVANIGSDSNWTGHTLAQANLFGFARLAWNPDLTGAEITEEWVRRTFGNDREVVDTITRMLMDSWEIYENYNAPLGIGWMVNPHYHYGPNVDGYEYSCWGTYHRADCFGIGVDRSVRTGTGFAGQYHPENAMQYETPETCPEKLLLFFHHVPYSFVLKNGNTMIQHIYDTHFAGVEQVKQLYQSWQSLSAKIDSIRYNQILARLHQQIKQAEEWRDVINTYFYRKSGIKDRLGREIF